MSRMRVGEWIAGVGAVGLFVLMFFDWFGVDGPARLDVPTRPVERLVGCSAPSRRPRGWSTLGWFMVTLLCVLIFGAAALSYMTIKRASPAWPVGAGVLTWLVGSPIFLVLLVRVCIAQPGIDRYVDVQLPPTSASSSRC